VTASIESIQWRIALLTIALSILWWISGRQGATGILAGGAVVLGSLRLLAKLFDAAIVTGRRRLAMALTFVKIAALLGLGWIALSNPSWVPDPLGFAIGVSTLPVAAVWEALKVRRL